VTNTFKTIFSALLLAPIMTTANDSVIGVPSVTAGDINAASTYGYSHKEGQSVTLTERITVFSGVEQAFPCEVTAEFTVTGYVTGGHPYIKVVQNTNFHLEDNVECLPPHSIMRSTVPGTQLHNDIGEHAQLRIISWDTGAFQMFGNEIYVTMTPSEIVFRSGESQHRSGLDNFARAQW